MPLTDTEGSGKKRFKAYRIGYFHLDVEPRGSPDIAKVRTEQGKLHLFMAVDRTSKFVFAQLHEKATCQIAADFLHALVEAVPYTIHTVLTDNRVAISRRDVSEADRDVQFAHTLADEDASSAEDTHIPWRIRQQARTGSVHAFEYSCDKHGISTG